MRKIPATMATQHPDHANKPYWHPEAFISSRHEAYECFLNFSELGVTEFKWDWEGKLVDESVVERFFGEHFEYFANHPLGVDRFLTFRLPNPKMETEFRLGRTFMTLSSAASVAKHVGLPTPPLFEVILPMTETANEIIDIQDAFQEMHSLKHPLFRLDENLLTNLRVIPLFEQVSTIIESDNILKKYFSQYKKKFNKLPPYFRPYVARSDPALNSGLIPTVLAIKIAFSNYLDLENSLGIPMNPIIGAAALPFRGGLNPYTVEQFADEYQGVRTTTIQSAFRYDYPKEDVIKAIGKIERIFPIKLPRHISPTEKKKLTEIIKSLEKFYQAKVEKMAPLINEIATQIPRRRERVQHIGLFGYSRGVGKVRLPRAITFTGSLYSIGIPPEFIGLSQSLEFIRKKGYFENLKKHYKYLKDNLVTAGRFINKTNIEKLSKKENLWKDILDDIKRAEKILDVEFSPQTSETREHHLLTTQIFERMDQKLPYGDLIEKAAILRKSLG